MIRFALVLATLGCGSRDPDVVTLEVTPLREAYRTDQQIVVTGRAEPDSRVVITASPTSAASIGQNGSVRLLEPGEVTLTGCSRGKRPGCAAITLLVDDGAPRLEIASPAPGAELDDDAIEVTGSVADARDARVFVNGNLVEVDELGQFAAEVPSAFGIVPIDVVATDGLGDPERVTFDVLWADAFGTAERAGSPDVALDDGLALSLGATFFDDDHPLDLEADPVVADDLADIVALLVANLELASMLPDPVVDQSPALFLRIPSITVGEVRPRVDIAEDALDFTLQLGQVQVATAGTVDLLGAPLDLTGSLTASATAYARLVVRTPADGPVEASVDDVVVTLDEARGDFASPEVDAIFDVASSTLRATLEEQLTLAIRAAVEDTLPSLLTDTLGALDGALSEVSVPLPVPGTAPIDLVLDGGLGSVDLEPGRAIVARLDTRFAVDADVVFPDSRGFPRFVGKGGDPLFRSPPVQLAMRLDLLNGALHTLWNAGLLDLDATALIPPDAGAFVQDAGLEGRLPPVIRPPRGPSPHDLVIDIGQLELDVTSLGVRSRFGISLSAGVGIELADGALRVTLADEPAVRAWLIEQDDAELVFIDEGTVEELLTSGLWPTLQEGLAGGLVLDLPELDAALLGGLGPGLDGLSFDYGLARPPELREGALVLDLRFSGEL